MGNMDTTADKGATVGTAGLDNDVASIVEINPAKGSPQTSDTSVEPHP